MRLPVVLGLGLAAVLLAGCAGMHRTPLSTNAKRVDTRYDKVSNIIFTPADWPEALPANLYVPKGDGPWPAVLLVYGGSWSSSDHRWQMSALARRLAKRGYVVMSATYRGAPEYIYPAPFNDLRQALRWLRLNAATYHVNPDKVAAFGFSAGGHLAALIGTMDGPPDVRVQAVVAVSAPTDLTLYPGGDILPRFLGATYQDNPALFREASAITYVTRDDPPFFLYHGKDDKTVAPQHSIGFQLALERAGVRNELHLIDGKGHGGMLLFNGDIEDQAIDFLDDVLR